MLARVLGLTVLYAAIGKLSLLLAIPPGYASPVWPAAGVAVVYLLRHGTGAAPGVLLGSMLVNMPLAWERWNAARLGVAAAIALGATVQAMVGVWLVRWRLGTPARVERGLNVAVVLLLAGPVACLINSGVSALVLLGSSSITWTEMAFTVFTWWTGDTLGVFLVLPVGLVFLLEPRSAWRSRWAFLALPLALCGVTLVCLFFYTARREDERRVALFRGRAGEHAHLLESRLAGYGETLHAVQRFVSVTDPLHPDDFRAFTAPLLARSVGLEAIEWLPRVTAEARAAYEQAMGDSDGLGIWQYDDHRRVRAGPRARYFPVRFTESRTGPSALGFDVASEPRRRAALEQARHTGELVATPSIPLVQQITGRDPAGVVVFAPVYLRGNGGRGELRGLVSAVFRFGDMMAEGVRAQARRGEILQLVDVSEGAETLCQFEDGQRVREGRPLAAALVFPLGLGGRRFELRFTPTSEATATQRSLASWAMQVGGMLVAGLLAAFLFAVLVREVGIERIIDDRTVALSRSEWLSRQILKASSDAFVAMDAQGRVVQWNPRAEEILGWRSEEILDRVMIDLVLPASAGEAARARLAAVFTAGTTGSASRLVEMELQHRSGRVFPVEIAASTALADDGWRLFVFIRDLSARKEDERRALAQLAEKELLVDELRKHQRTEALTLDGLIDVWRRLVASGSGPARLARALDDLSLVQTALRAVADRQHVGLDGLISQVIEKHARGSSVTLETDRLVVGLDVAVGAGLLVADLLSGWPQSVARLELLVRRAHSHELELVVRGGPLPDLEHTRGVVAWLGGALEVSVEAVVVRLPMRTDPPSTAGG